MQSKEIWKEINEFEGYYEVSNLCRVRSIGRYVNSKNNSKSFKPSRIMNPTKNSSGYLYYNLNKNNKTKKIFAHRLVANAFIPKTEGKDQVNHKNGIKTDNRIENLEWCNASENIKHAYDNGFMKSPCYWSGKLGKYHHSSIPILQISINGKLIKEYSSCVDAERETGINNINAVVNGRLKTAGGFVWVRKTEEVK